MRNFHLSTLAFVDFGYKTPCESLKSHSTLEVARAFINNMDRVAALPLYPFKLWVASEGRFNAINREVVRLTGEPYPAILTKNPAKFEATRPLAEARLKQIPLEKMQALETEIMSRGGPDSWADWDEEMVVCSDYLSKAFEAVLSGMIVGTWTAFETLTGDLWIATLNTHPRDLDRLRGEEKRIHKTARKHREVMEKGATLPPDKPNPRQQEGEKEIQIKAIYEVTEGSYDLSARMGELLRTKVDFTTLYEIRRAYSLAFDYRRVGRKVTGAVDESLANTALDALAQVRNVVVHKAGIADAEYEMHRATLPTMPQVVKGQPVLLDGEKVKDLVSPVVACCVNLLTSIDDWLGGGPESSECNTVASI